MNCKQMMALLSAFVDGELSAAEELQVREHLAQCSECRALYEQLQALHTSFSDLEEIPAPENFAQSVMNRIRAEEKPRVIPLFKRPQVRAVMGLAACAVLCIGFGRVALDGGMKGASAEPAAAPAAPVPESAVYDVQESGVQYSAGSIMEARIDDNMIQQAELPQGESDIVGMTAAPEPCEPSPAPAEPAPEMQTDSSPAEKATAGGEIILSELPEGLEDVIGLLRWEERTQDGVLCAQLTREQALLVMELVREQELSFLTNVADEASPDMWTLILEP